MNKKLNAKKTNKGTWQDVKNLNRDAHKRETKTQ